MSWKPFPKLRPIWIEISGEFDYGKTHLACTFPNPAFADTEQKAWIVLEKFNNPRWFPVKTFQDFRDFVAICEKSDDIQTIVIDSGSDLVDLAYKEHVEVDRRPTYPIYYAYGKIYEKIDTLVSRIKLTGKHFVVTSRLKDEYVVKDFDREGNPIYEKTGRRLRDGYKKFPWNLEILLRLEKGVKIGDKVYYPERIFGRVIKNNFLGHNERKPFLFNVSYQGIVDELLKPYHGDLLADLHQFMLEHG